MHFIRRTRRIDGRISTKKSPPVGEAYGLDKQAGVVKIAITIPKEK
jgi:hypothetical protein